MTEDIQSFFQPTAEEMADVVSMFKIAPEERECYYTEREIFFDEERDG